MSDFVTDVLAEHADVIRLVGKELSGPMVQIAELISEALRSGNKLLTMGNGGSAADAQHFAAEMVGRFQRERAAWPAVALATDPALLTALGNDYGFEQIFSRQIEALAAPGDVVISLSTSGRSENVIRGLQTARARGCVTVGLLGGDGGTMKDLVDHALVVPSVNTPRIQEAHITMIHIICEYVEQALAGQPSAQPDGDVE